MHARNRYPDVAATLLSILVLSLAWTSNASEFGAFDDPVSIRAYTGLSSASQGGTLPIAVRLDISTPWHINAHRVLDEYLIPTQVAVQTPPGLKVRKIVYPEAIEKRLAFSDDPLALYEHEVLIGILIDISNDFPTGDTTIVATVTYQACDNEKCIAPVDQQVAIAFRVSSPLEAIDATHADVISRIDFGRISTPMRPEGAEGSEEAGAFRQIIASRGWLVAFLLVFAGGLALNLTPCVYPVIPITIGYFGGQSGGKTSRTVSLAFLYLLGMATMYSLLGLVASLTGSIFGSALQNPIVLSLIALVMVGLALSMFGLYEIRIPVRLSNYAGTSQQGFLGAFLMGLTVGIVAAPCIGPFVLALLTFVGESGNLFLGFSIFFVLALGLGLPFVVLAIISGSISKLPKSGEWMEWIRKLFGVILLAMAVYFLKPVTAEWLNVSLMALLFAASGIILGFILRTESSALLFRTFRRLVGIAGPLFGIYVILSFTNILPINKTTGIQWLPYSTDALAKAKAEGRFVMIDFSADWCIPCKELDHKTFSQEKVVRAAEGMVALKADLTQTGSEAVDHLRKTYEIRGVPTVVFIDRNGNEKRDLRLVGFTDKDGFVGRLEHLKGGTM
jgi:thiol:disulfide interchange protein DsbD